VEGREEKGMGKGGGEEGMGGGICAVVHFP